MIPSQNRRIVRLDNAITTIPPENQTAARTDSLPSNALAQRDDTRLHPRHGILHVMAGLSLCPRLFFDDREIVREMPQGVSAFAIRRLGADAVPNVAQPLDVPHRKVNGLGTVWPDTTVKALLRVPKNSALAFAARTAFNGRNRTARLLKLVRFLEKDAQAIVLRVPDRVNAFVMF